MTISVEVVFGNAPEELILVRLNCRVDGELLYVKFPVCDVDLLVEAADGLDVKAQVPVLGRTILLEGIYI